MLISEKALKIPVAADMVAADIAPAFPSAGVFILAGGILRRILLVGVLFILGFLVLVSFLPASAAEFGAGMEKAAPDKKSKKGKKDDGKGDASSSGDVGMLRKGEEGEPSYYTLPDILVNLASQEGRPYFLKLKLTMESEDYSTFDSVPKIMPRLTDSLLLFLRELHIDDLNGSAGGYRLRLELLRRLNKAMAPRRIDAVLIEEMLIQ